MAADDRGATPIVDVDYITADGVPLRGRVLDRAGHHNTVLFFHGNGTKAKWLDEWIRRLSYEFDATVMVAEYRGFDDTQHTPDETAVICDCIAAHEFLCQREDIQPREIILYGRSLGGGCAVAVAAACGTKALVLDRTFDRMTDVAASRYPFFPVRWLMRNQYDSVARLSNYDGPLIQLHGTTDTVIPISHGKNLYASAGCRPKHWIEVLGLGHNVDLSTSQLRQMAAKIGEFTTDVEPQ